MNDISLKSTKPNLTKQDELKIIKEANSGQFQQLKLIKSLNSSYHWSELKYNKQTGDTLLHLFARLGQSEAVRYLLTEFQPSGVNIKNNDNKSALHEAVQFRNYEIVQLLIEFQAEINCLKRSDWTALMLACTKISQPKICYEIAKLLLENGALVNYPNKDGWTVLHLISREGCVEILQLLIQYDLDLNSVTKNGRNCLHIACLNGRLDFVKFLLNSQLVNRLIQAKDSCGNQPLHEAVLSQNLGLCRLLINSGADINCRNNSGSNLLHLAVSKNSKELILFILNDLKLDIDSKSLNGFTGLHYAAKFKQFDNYQLLLDLGADIEIRDDLGRIASEYF